MTMVIATTELLTERCDGYVTSPRTRFLIVDDSDSTRCFLKNVLESCETFEVAGEASNGVLAVALAATLKPDVVLLDLSMPGADGSVALEGLRLVAPDAVVIVLSGTAAAAAPRLLAAGAAAFISKGLAPWALLDELDIVLSQRAASTF